MLVVADSSPLIALANIGALRVLPALFESVTIPPQVADELSSPRRPQAVRNFIAQPPSWLEVRAPLTVQKIPLLQPAESAAISLVIELNADLLLIDEVQGRKAAAARKIQFTGTVGVLELAATGKLLVLGEAFELLKKTDFWISHKLLDERLELFLSRQLPQPPSAS